MSMRKQDRQADADALETALEFAAAGNAREDARVQIAELLFPAVPIRETQRARTKERTLRAFAAAGTQRTENAGSQDTPDMGVHTAEVDVNGAQVRMADVEKIDPDQAAQIAVQVEELAALEAAWEADR